MTHNSIKRMFVFLLVFTLATPLVLAVIDNTGASFPDQFPGWVAGPGGMKFIVNNMSGINLTNMTQDASTTATVMYLEYENRTQIMNVSIVSDVGVFNVNIDPGTYYILSGGPTDASSYTLSCADNTFGGFPITGTNINYTAYWDGNSDNTNRQSCQVVSVGSEDFSLPPFIGIAARREEHFDNILPDNVTVNNPNYAVILLETVTIPTNTTGYFTATVNIFSTGSSTSLCRLTVNDTEHSSEQTRTNTAGTYGSLYLQTSNITLNTGDYSVALECKRSGGGAYIVTASTIEGITNNLSIDFNNYAGLTLTPDWSIIQSDTYTTTNTTNNATRPIYLIANYNAEYMYDSDGTIETVLELGGVNCSTIPRDGTTGTTGSMGGGCILEATNETTYDIKIYGRGDGSLNYTLNLKETVLPNSEQNQTNLTGKTVENGALQFITGFNITTTENLLAIYAKAGIPTNGTGTVTYELRLSGDKNVTGQQVRRTLSTGVGVAIIHELFKNINIGNYTIELWGGCETNTCQIQGGDLIAYTTKQLSTTLTGFNITAIDLFDDSTINTFLVQQEQINFTTNTANIFIPTDKTLENFTVHKDNYFTDNVTQFNTSFNYTSNLSQGWMVNETFFTLFLTQFNVTNFNATIGGKTYNNATNNTQIYLRQGENTITINISEWFPNTLTVDHTALTTTTPNLTGFYDAIWIIGAQDEAGAGLASFTVHAFNDTRIDQTRNTTTGNVTWNLVQGHYYNFNITKSGFRNNFTQINVNTSTGLYNATLEGIKIFMTFLDELNRTIIGQNISVGVIDANNNQTAFTTNTSNLTLSGEFPPGFYTIRYGAFGYSFRDFYFTLGFENANLTLYLIQNDDFTPGVVEVRTADGSPLEGAIVKLIRYYGDPNLPNTVQMATTNTDGMATMTAESVTAFYTWEVEVNQQTRFISNTPELLVVDLDGLWHKTFVLSPTPLEFRSQYFGFNISFTPTTNTLINGTTYNFTTTIQSGHWNLTACTFQILNASNGAILAGPPSSFCSIINNNGTSTLSYTTTQNPERILTQLTVNTGEFTTIYQNLYQTIEFSNESFTLKDFTDDLNRFEGAGFNDFTKFFIAILIIIVTVVTLSTRAALLGSPHETTFLIFVLSLPFSYIGWLNIAIDTIPSPEVKKWLMSMLLGLLAIASIFNKWELSK